MKTNQPASTTKGKVGVAYSKQQEESKVVPILLGFSIAFFLIVCAIGAWLYVTKMDEPKQMSTGNAHTTDMVTFLSSRTYMPADLGHDDPMIENTTIESIIMDPDSKVTIEDNVEEIGGIIRDVGQTLGEQVKEITESDPDPEVTEPKNPEPEVSDSVVTYEPVEEPEVPEVETEIEVEEPPIVVDVTTEEEIPMEDNTVEDPVPEEVPIVEENVPYYFDNFTTDSSVMVSSNLTAEQIEGLINNHSGLAGLGQVIYDIEQEYGVCAYFTIAVAGVESGYGSSYLARNSNNLFGLMGCSFSSKSECILYFGRLMQNYQNAHGVTMSATGIGKRYCETGIWNRDVTTIMNQMVDKAVSLY